MSDKPGLLIVNLGSPNAPDTKSVRKFLFEFLHDKRVIDTSRWIWCPILHGIILRTRPARSAKAYAKVWGDPDGEGVLISITRQQAAGISKRLGSGVHVEVAMRYGNPSIGAGLDALKAKECSRVAVLPMYPQFAGATTASIYDGVAKALMKRKDVPEIRILRDYHDDLRYIKCLGKSLTDHLAGMDWAPDLILTSYHGLPQSYVDEGDPYQDECIKTTDLLRDHLKMTPDTLRTTFQSRFGPKAWLKPYTDKTLEALPDLGIKNVAVMMPGFAADCLETLEEIKIEAHETFMEHGGENFTAVPCLNDNSDHLDFLAELSRERLLTGWL